MTPAVVNPDRHIRFVVKVRGICSTVCIAPLSLDAIQQLADAAYNITGRSVTSFLGHHRLRREYLVLWNVEGDLVDGQIPFATDAVLPDDVLYAVVEP